MLLKVDLVHLGVAARLLFCVIDTGIRKMKNPSKLHMLGLLTFGGRQADLIKEMRTVSTIDFRVVLVETTSLHWKTVRRSNHKKIVSLI